MRRVIVGRYWFLSSGAVVSSGVAVSYGMSVTRDA